MDALPHLYSDPAGAAGTSGSHGRHLRMFEEKPDGLSHSYLDLLGKDGQTPHARLDPLPSWEAKPAISPNFLAISSKRLVAC